MADEALPKSRGGFAKFFLSARLAWHAFWGGLPLVVQKASRRAILLMYEVEGTTIPAIARLLGVNTVTVRWHPSIGHREVANAIGKGTR